MFLGLDPRRNPQSNLARCSWSSSRCVWCGVRSRFSLSSKPQIPTNVRSWSSRCVAWCSWFSLGLTLTLLRGKAGTCTCGIKDRCPACNLPLQAGRRLQPLDQHRQAAVRAPGRRRQAGGVVACGTTTTPLWHAREAPVVCSGRHGGWGGRGNISHTAAVTCNRDFRCCGMPALLVLVCRDWCGVSCWHACGLCPVDPSLDIR